MPKELDDLVRKVSEMLVEYNQDRAYDEDNRIGGIQVILTRPEERAGEEKPTAIYITTKDFYREATEKGAPSVPTFNYGSAVVTYSYSTSSSLACCAPGWIGIFDSQGVPHFCFPDPNGPCSGYIGPIRCAV